MRNSISVLFYTYFIINIIIKYDQASLIWGKKLNMVFFPIFSFRNSVSVLVSEIPHF